MSWPLVSFSDVVGDFTGGNPKVKSGAYLETGSLPVIDQGKKYIGGYVNDITLACSVDLPVVIFGDHTKELKFLDQRFAMGADGIKVLKPNDDRLDEKYLYYFLKQARLPNDAGYSRHFKFLKRLKIPLPPLDEQKRIAAILDKADGLRRKREKAIQLTDTLLRAVFLDMFGDPVTNPMGWAVNNLGNSIAHANNGLSRRRKTQENIGDLVLRLQDIHYDGIRFNKILNRINLKTAEKNRFGVDINDILFVRVNGNPNYVGRSAVFQGHLEPVYHNDHLIRLKIDKSYNPKFLCYLLNFPESRSIISTQIKTSAGQHTISQGGIRNLQFYVPPITQQDKFSEFLSAIQLMDFKPQKIDTLCAVLSQRAFRGELIAEELV